MKLLVLSDLHLTHTRFPVIQDGRRVDEGVDAVILAGDIDEGVKGIEWARRTFDKPIFYVSGNHELYGQDWGSHVDLMRQEAIKFDVNFMENDEIEFVGIRFLGCTLWTNFDLYGTQSESMATCSAKMNDYNRIQTAGGRLSPNHTLSRHQASVQWLSERLRAGEPTKTVVITHHAPHPRSIPTNYTGHPMAAAYANDLAWLMCGTDLWIHGHIHGHSDYWVGGQTRVVSNALGYPTKTALKTVGFDPFFTVEV